SSATSGTPTSRSSPAPTRAAPYAGWRRTPAWCSNACKPSAISRTTCSSRPRSSALESSKTRSPRACDSMLCRAPGSSRCAGRRSADMKVLVLSVAFPSASRPTYGVFVRERVRHVAARMEVVVVAPVPWFPFNRLFRGDALATTPLVEVQDGLTVYHPRVACLPGVGKTLDGVLYALSLVAFISRLRRSFAFDVIDAHFTYPDGVAAVLLGKLFHTPAVITIRGTHDIRNARSPLRRIQIRSALPAAAGVIAVSDSTRPFAEQLGIDGRRIRVIPNGIDTDRFLPGNRADARAQLGLPADRTILLSVGG